MLQLVGYLLENARDWSSIPLPAAVPVEGGSQGGHQGHPGGRGCRWQAGHTQNMMDEVDFAKGWSWLLLHLV